MTPREHAEMLRARESILAALIKEARKRRYCIGHEWIENERSAVVRAANTWARRNGRSIRIDSRDVERVEGCAVGHIDYARKLSLYVAELLYPAPSRSLEETP